MNEGGHLHDTETKVCAAQLHHLGHVVAEGGLDDPVAQTEQQHHHPAECALGDAEDYSGHHQVDAHQALSV